ncbi:NADH-quinone oxidoreductase subunit 5 family protein [Parachryseolinea silvisoli]|uniref:NADH-quinone oxidoreductase subunit 5 family protein n=1 Tax=Parachryseolinea silvisoli TaxID=2873601 RepID=UPI002265CDBD|nr:NADH-quinone oxidoreductase subunit L [Parachryseolinea silvisoli]MCD9019545.1 NADH-quinone oxidoreductase subunit L [Parachryseolinea silvisoli]
MLFLLTQTPPVDFTGIYRISLLLVVGMPLLSAIICLVLPARKPGWVMATASVLLLLGLLAAGALFGSIGGERYGLISFTWFQLGGKAFDISIFLNERSVRMLVLVMLVSFLVHVYSVAYMAGDAALKRYYAALGFFTFSMLGIVLTHNLLVMFVFWELVGFSSYMLIGHWRDRPAAAAAAKKAFVMNRIGDAGFIIGLMIYWAAVGSLDYGQVGYSYDDLFSHWKTAGALCIFCGVIGKSAQFPLFTWLPDAMEGPTPASALIHAATMVAAGVFLLVQMHELFTPVSLDVIAVVGVTTALAAALAALAQTDLKKILAYSTVSQLGFMVMAVGAGAPQAAFLHLFTHGFFKACLFLCAGAVIHALHEAQHGTHEHFDVQDIRNLGGLRHKLPFTFVAFIISGAALAGLPFFSGFLSKDAILTSLLYWKGDVFSWRHIVFGGAFLVSFLTALYTFRLMASIFFGSEQKTAGLTVHEPSWYMRAPIALLALGSCWFLVSWNPLNYYGWLYAPWKADENFHSSILVFVSAAWALIACAVGYFLYNRRYTAQAAVLQQAFYVDKVYLWLATRPVLALAFFTEKIDRRWIDGFLHFTAYGHVTLAYLTGWFDRVIIDGSVNGMAWLVRTIGSFTRSFQGGKIQLYIFWSVLAIIIFLIWTLL